MERIPKIAVSALLLGLLLATGCGRKAPPTLPPATDAAVMGVMEQVAPV
jgi:predicted small lipoprotein YifL